MEAISAELISLAKVLVGASPVVCDVGSRDALESTFLSRALHASELHVFEPNPEAANNCRKHLANVTEHKVHFNECAVSDKPGAVTFYGVDTALSDNKDIGFSSFFPINPDYTRRRGRIVQKAFRVAATTLDLYFESRRPPSVLWIDAEGAELLVLRGGERVLQSVRLIHVEVSFRPMQVGKPLFWEIEAYLKQRAFVLREFPEVSSLRGFLYRHRLLPNLPWRLNAVFCRED